MTKQREDTRSSDLVGLGYRGSDGAMTCVLCDYEMEWIECQECGGDGFFDAYEDDPMWYDEGDTKDCLACNGAGGEYWCDNRQCKTRVCTRVVSKPNRGAEE